MRHGNTNRKFGLKKGRRASFVTGLIANLITKGRITTTEARAKELKTKAEKIVTLAKKDTLAGIRMLTARLHNNPTLAKKAKKWAEKYADRKGGYTRVMKLPPRKSDSAKMAIIEFVD